VLAVKTLRAGLAARARQVACASPDGLRCGVTPFRTTGNPACAIERIAIMTQLSTFRPAITARRIPDEERLNFLPRHFHMWCVKVESAVFDHLQQLSADYQGGYWVFYDLSNGGCFMAPSHGELRIEAPNQFSATVDADTAGIIATLYALSDLSFELPTKDIFATRFHQLRSFAGEHPRAKEIFAAID
jgi:hypothetical protein